MTRLEQAMRDERGSTILVVAIAMTAMLSIVALAIDVGMLFTARSEAQRMADSASLAGAAAFIEQPFDPEPRARELAVDFAARNTVRDELVPLDAGDVVVDVPNRRVTVTVRRVGDRGNAVATWFARIFGVDEVDVSARATAEAVPTNAATCMMPFTVPDGWDDKNKNHEYNPGEYYDPHVTGYGTDFRNGVPSEPNGIDPPGTTYVNDVGRPMALKQGTPQELAVDSWFRPWDVPQVSGAPDVGADRYRWNIGNCNPAVIHIGEAYDVENGNMDGPTRAGVKERMEKDPDAYWDPTTNTVKGSNKGDAWKASDRIVNIPFHDPTIKIVPGKKPLVFNNFAAFFLEGIKGKDVIGRFLYASGVGDGTYGTGAPDDGVGPMTMFVRLVE